ncbi:hypothetical protein BGZ54_010026, partial [Gamsiella multidivaricata]
MDINDRPSEASSPETLRQGQGDNTAHPSDSVQLRRGDTHHMTKEALSNGAQHDVSSKNAHGTLNTNKQRRRKAQFEVGDGRREEEQEVQVQGERQRQGQDHDQETIAGVDTKDDDAQLHRNHSVSHNRHTSRRQSSSSAAVAAAAAATTTPEVANGSQAEGLSRVQDAQHDREEDSLAKTLIDSTLTLSMQDLGLQHNQDLGYHATATAESEPEPSSHEHIQQHESAEIRTQSSNPTTADQQKGDQKGQSTKTAATNPSHNNQQHESSKGNQSQSGSKQPPLKDQHPIHPSGERAGHALEKSRSNPPEVVSNGEGPSRVTHKSSASIHESQNLSGSSTKPKSRAPTRPSPASKRLSMLLDPRTSVTPQPSLTKVTTHTVMAINPKHTAVVGTDASPSVTTSDSSRHQGFKVSSPTMQPSPAVEMVSKFLTGATASAAHSAEDDDHHHPHHAANGSPNSNRRSPKGGHDKSNATSPQQRAGFTSKFYPASPSQPQLSSSAPKSTTTSNQLIPPTIVTTSSSDENLHETGGVSPFSASALSSASAASAIAAAAVAQSNLTNNGSKTGTLSRTQQKLWLQRENVQDVDEDEMARRGRVQKEMDRINREYKCVRMTLDPSMDSMLRCLARCGKSPLELQQQQQLQQQLLQQQQQQQSQSQSQQGHHGAGQYADQHQPRGLQHHRSLQQLNGHYQAQPQQQQLGGHQGGG